MKMEYATNWNSFVLWTIALLFSIVRCSDASTDHLLNCTARGVHITLGDYYTMEQKPYELEATSEIFKIGLVVETPCRPPVLYFQPCPQNTKFPCTLRETNDNDISEETPSGAIYERSAYFYSITSEHLSYFSQWKVNSNGTWIHFPKGVTKAGGSVRLIVMSDMDISPASEDTRKWLLSKREMGSDGLSYDLIAHVGDFAYDLQDDGGERGDRFFDEMSKSITSRVPYIITFGNHDNYKDGEFLNYRFEMPGTKDSKWKNRYYDFIYKGMYVMACDLGDIARYHPENEMEIFEWVEKRLKLAYEREDVVWIVFISHKSIVCNDIEFTPECFFNFYPLKKFEDLFIKYDVDLVVNGHLHIYSRYKPFYNFQLQKQSGVESPMKLYSQIIAGNAGTSVSEPPQSSFKKTELLLPFVASVYLTGPTVLSIEFNGDNIKVDAIDTETGKAVDHWRRDFKPGKRWGLWIITIVIIAGAGWVVYIWWQSKKRSEALSELKKEEELLPKQPESYSPAEAPRKVRDAGRADRPMIVISPEREDMRTSKKQTLQRSDTNNHLKI